MARKKLDAFLINFPQDTRYLTGFSGEDSWMVVTPRSVTLLSDRRFEEELAVHTPYVKAVMRKKSLASELGQMVRRHRVRALGIQSEHMTLATQKAITKEVPSRILKTTFDWLVEQRSVKDVAEVEIIRQAAQIQEQAFGRMLKKIKAGMTEKQVCAILEFEMKSLGADGPSFSTIIAAGPNSSIPHYRPGEVKIERNQPLLVDFGAVYKGYCSDMTRVVVLGRFPAKIREIYKIVREAMLAGIAAVRPGANLKEVDAAARKIIQKAGYGKQFGHGLGHGIGLEIHEEPRLSWLAKGRLKPGQVVTVEPGIYLPGLGGVRLEDDLLVTESGHRNLCSLPTDLESAMI